MRHTVTMSLFFYNLAKPHQTLTEAAHGRPTTPAMAAGLAARPWTIEDLVKLIEAREPSAVDRRRRDRRT